MNEFEDFLPEDLDTMLDLPFHLTKGEAVEDLYEILTDFMFLDYKLSRKKEVQSLIEDYRLALESQLVFSNEDRRVLELIFRAVEQSANVLQQDKYQLPGQLLGKLMKIDEPKLKPFLEQVKDWREYAWLKPIKVEMVSPQDSLVRTIAGGNIFHAMAISDDGKFAVTVRNGLVEQWNLKTGVLIKDFTIRETYRVIASNFYNFDSVEDEEDGKNKKQQIINNIIVEKEIIERTQFNLITISPDGNWVGTVSSREIGAVTKIAVFELWNLHENSSILCFPLARSTAYNGYRDDGCYCLALSLNAKYLTFGRNEDFSRLSLYVVDLEKYFLQILDFRSINIKSCVPGYHEKIDPNNRTSSYLNHLSWIWIDIDNEKEIDTLAIEDNNRWLIVRQGEYIKIWDLVKGRLQLIIRVNNIPSIKRFKLHSSKSLLFLITSMGVYKVNLKNYLMKDYDILDKKWVRVINFLKKTITYFSFPKIEDEDEKIDKINKFFSDIFDEFPSLHFKYSYLEKNSEDDLIKLNCSFKYYNYNNLFQRLVYLLVNKKITNLRKLRTLPITKININIPSYIVPDDITPDFQWFILKGNNGGIELWHL
ncbi:hypothetical protein [Microcystis aeruginosa]|jgi:hypothetical protein|uniref:hypothetical protein n=1 Tax=Microcystis aeruginosa TaxID=1126 RepID=UPI000261BF72|nr:hypothetical protein [Microcystis aeruginosa]CCI07751.1 hypothetical protein MICAD_2770008 [Microcystis aeruginosa PCC 7941]